MSDAKSHGGEEGGGGGNPFVDFIFWFLFVLVFITILKSGFEKVGFSFDWIPSLSQVFGSIFNTVQVFSIFLSLLFLLGIIYFNFRLGQLEHHGHGHVHDSHGHGDEHGHSGHSTHLDHQEMEKSDKWQVIQNHLNSHNPADWRLSIIESDILLFDMLKRMGYHGDSVGDILKQVERSDFKTLDEAWEAHKVRNRIAHDGSSFHFDHNEAKRVVGLYQKVFEEFYFI